MCCCRAGMAGVRVRSQVDAALCANRAYCSPEVLGLHGTWPCSVEQLRYSHVFNGLMQRARSAQLGAERVLGPMPWRGQHASCTGSPEPSGLVSTLLAFLPARERAPKATFGGPPACVQNCGCPEASVSHHICQTRAGRANTGLAGLTVSCMSSKERASGARSTCGVKSPRARQRQSALAWAPQARQQT